jgi:hypothetical protein
MQVAEGKLRDPYSKSGMSLPRAYSPALQPLYQSLLTTLANMDLEHEHDRATLGRSIADEAVRLRALERLRERHRERRTPYLHQLAILQDRIQQGWH